MVMPHRFPEILSKKGKQNWKFPGPKTIWEIKVCSHGGTVNFLSPRLFPSNRCLFAWVVFCFALTTCARTAFAPENVSQNNSFSFIVKYFVSYIVNGEAYIVMDLSNFFFKFEIFSSFFIITYVFLLIKKSEDEKNDAKHS